VTESAARPAGTRRFEGKTAIVTAASRGIGLGIAFRLATEGANVVITAREPEALDEAADALAASAAVAAAGTGAAGADQKGILAVAGRADDPVHQKETVERTLDTFGGLDYLVNNAGINPAYGPLVELDLDTGRKIVEVNVLAALSWVQHAYRAAMKEHGGAIVNVSSLGSLRTSRGIAFYGASKAMLTHLTANLAHELAPRIRVNAVAPAVVKTRFARALYEGREEEVAAGYPMKRLGTPDDVGAAVAYLLSDDASWVTGQQIVLDGGPQ
jgi:NAD(P)-dependent dehydrogenase (short-subunit alcohol dehydrogenase family)